MTKHKQLLYDVIGACVLCNVHEHPQTQMKNLGYKVIGSVPQSFSDSWWFTVEEFIEPLEPYLEKVNYNYDYWHGECFKDCEYFKENASCCWGGFACKKKTD